MKNAVQIICKHPVYEMHDFYISTREGDFFLFRQGYRQDTEDFFSEGVRLERALDFSLSHKSSALLRTMKKLPLYIRYVEQEHGLVILEKTRRKQSARRTARRADSRADETVGAA